MTPWEGMYIRADGSYFRPELPKTRPGSIWWLKSWSRYQAAQATFAAIYNAMRRERA